jgi:acyl-CoA thioesterase-1
MENEAMHHNGSPMRRRLSLIWLALPVAFWAACAGQPGPDAAAASAPPPAVETAAPAAGPRVVFLGDSLTYGLGLEREEAIPALIQDRIDAAGLPWVAVNRGVSGDTSAAGLRRLDLALEGDVRLVVIELGANDMLRGLQPGQMRDNLRAIIERCQAEGIEVVLTGMEALPNYGEAYTREFRSVFRDLADEYGLVFMPFFLEGVAGDPSLNQRDMMHPNADGARVVADALWQVLAPLLG